MSGEADVEVARSSVVGTVTIDRYGCPRFDREHLATARERFVQAARRLGFAHDRALEGSGRHEDVYDAVSAFARQPAERKILYWTGHGQIDDPHYRLVCADGYDAEGKLVRSNTVTFDDVVTMFSHDPADVLLVIDACYSERRLGHAAMADLLNQWERREANRRAGTSPGLAVVCTARADQQAEAGQWVDWLVDTVNDPHAAVRTEHLDERLFHPTAKSVELSHLLHAVDGHVPDDDWSQRPVAREIRRLRPGFLHNPYFTSRRFPPARRPPDDRSWFRLGPGPGSRGAFSTGGDLKHFSGRHRALGRVVRWMETHDHGLLAVTGPAGSGKTAFIGCLVHLTIPGFPETMAAQPPAVVQPRPDSVHAAVHCAGKSLHELADDVCKALEPMLGPPGQQTAPPAPGAGATIAERVAWVGALVDGAGSLVLVFDGLDEAAPGQATDIARDFLNPLSAVPGVKVLVGTRDRPRRTAPGRVSEESLPEALRQTVPAVELDQDDDSEADIARHVGRVLAAEGSPYAARVDERIQAAQRIAALSHRNFLVADLCARDLVRRDETLPPQALDEIARRGTRDLDPFLDRELMAVADVIPPVSGDDWEDEDDPDAERGRRLRDLLLPVAATQGAGLPASLWLVLANAVRQEPSPEFTGELLSSVANRTQGALTASVSDDDRVLHRMLHPSFGAWLLADTDQQRLHRRIFQALHRHARGDWAGADPYIRRHLAAHAALGGRDLLARLLDDDEFLVHADPDILLPLVGTGPDAGRREQLYRRVAGEFQQRPSPQDRRALLLAERRVHYPEDYVPSRAQLWRDQWTDAGPEPLHQQWPGPAGAVTAVHWSAHGSGDDLITAAGRGEVASRRPRTGLRTRVHRSSAVPWETGGFLFGVCEVGSGLGRMVAALDGRGVLLWRGDANLPVHRLFWGGRPQSLTAAEFYGQSYLAAADGGRAWLWRWPARHPPADHEITRVSLGLPAARVALLALDEALLLLTAEHGELVVHRLPWRHRPGGPAVELSRHVGTVGEVTAVAALATGPDSAWLAAAGTEVRLWRLTDAGRTLTAGEEESAGVACTARAIALGRAGDRPVLAVQDDDDLVTVRHMGEAAPFTWFQAGKKYASLSFDPRGSGSLAVADESHVRVVPPTRRAGGPRRRRRQDERSLVHLTAHSDGSVLLSRVRGSDVLLGSRTATGTLYQDAGVLAHQDKEAVVGAVTALATRDGWAVASAAGRVIRLWHVPSRPGPAHLTKELRLPGDQKDEPLSGALCETGGRLHWFVPRSQRLEHWATENDGWGADGSGANGSGADGSGADGSGGTHWRTLPAVNVQDTAKIRWTQTLAAPDGRLWLAAECGASVRLWCLDEEANPSADRKPLTVRPPTPPRHLALGVLCEDDRVTPLLAGADRQHIWLAVAGPGDRAAPTTLPPPARIPDPTGVVLVGPPYHPLLVVCGKGADSAAVWDVVGRRWVAAVPYRGYDVEAAAAVWDGRDVRLVLQGEDRCDELVLDGDRLADLLGIETGWFGRRWYGPVGS
ncbi:hypothetical protein H0H10_05360 [Streptomyces sp. TRM S81-3]|uniref:Peptidase C14 caspase catalytic subunit p20 n=1 Tax=Streptomyces griseicoloratus TaxID=2752516 RepID=A0A926KZ33_9ACTN|nr:hypothetical protein [Streptomyces griseicoloratus]MBD0418606.1 hypothetical protein [Streptomyces griseicoloratus]